VAVAVAVRSATGRVPSSHQAAAPSSAASSKPPSSGHSQRGVAGPSSSRCRPSMRSAFSRFESMSLGFDE
jgi:hypothetical protein